MEKTYNDYFEYLEDNPEELERMIGLEDYIWKTMLGMVVRND
jgi:hypothetical protein